MFVGNLIQEITPCDQGVSCRNSVENSSMATTKCSLCRLAPGNEDFEHQFWSGIKGAKHPILEQERKDKNVKVARDKQIVRMGKDKKRKKLLVRATKAEAITEQAIIKSTVNSGRLNKDGDHLLADCITLDTKLQTNRLHPKVDLGELDKVGSDAKRAGQMMGALVLRNSQNVGVVVMKEEDFATLIALWRNNASKE